MKPGKILVIQTAFIGDVVLALPVPQALRKKFPESEIHFLLRKGNESLLDNHTSINKVWIWDKNNNKNSGLFKLILKLRKERFDLVINLQRYFSSGLFTVFCGAKKSLGFTKNPLSFFFSKSYPHIIGSKTDKAYLHETERNLSLLSDFVQFKNAIKPELFPIKSDYDKITNYVPDGPMFVLAPASVWFTKQYHQEGWKSLALNLSKIGTVITVGGKNDFPFCNTILDSIPNGINLAGSLTFLETAALMTHAKRVFANDSAPLHFASGVNASVTAIFCSTIPQFGFGPLSDDSIIVETSLELACKPCGLHGKKSCPEGHFKCATTIKTEKLIETIR